MKITVTAGIIQHDGKILIAQRKKSKSLGGYWEFPGGKIEPGETCSACLAREIKEEFDISIDVGDFLMETDYAYDFGDLKMYVYRALWNGQGDIHICDHEAYRWVRLDELKNFNFAPADVPVVEKICA